MKLARTLTVLSIALLLQGLSVMAPQPFDAFSPQALAQPAPTEGSRPTATKSSNTWICFVTAGVVGVIVFLIGRWDRQNQEAPPPSPKSASNEAGAKSDEDDATSDDPKKD